jgi:ABC-type branched-subunit amino acid transport system ATPase component
MMTEAFSDPILRIAGLTKAFGGMKAVDDVHLDVAGPSITSLIGPNGAGKTAVFNLISGLLQPTSGEVSYRKRLITGLPPTQIARAGIGRTFQEPRAFGRLSVLENILLGFQNQKGERVHHALLKTRGSVKQERENREKAMELVEFVGLSGRSKDLAQSLSHGQQRFLSIGRVLASGPDLLLLDEPTVGLHREEISRLIDLLVDLVENQKRTVLLIEHNMDVVMNISKEIHVLVEGKKFVHGTPDEIKENPRIVEAFLGTTIPRNLQTGGAQCS